MTLEPRDYIAITGWIVTFFLGAISAGVVVPRLTKKRKIVAWAVMAESDLVPRELSQVLGMPVVLQVGNYQPESLSVVKLRFGCAGNDVVEKFTIGVFFNDETNILEIRSITNLREYGKEIKWKFDENNCHIDVAFINPGRSFELEFILSNHESGIIDVDVAAPGLELKRKSPTVWDVELSPSFLRSIGFSALGIRIDPAAIAMTEISEELRAIRRQLRKP
ncbi:MAG: hypothetical protein WA939_10580 [Nodosilinea sp.]